MRNVTAADADSRGNIWAATSGGVFMHNLGAGTTNEFRNIGALQSLDCTSLFCDNRTGLVFVGGRSGTLDIYHPSGVWQNVGDIRKATQYPRRQINNFAMRGDTLLIATDFGIVTYDVARNVFIETIDRIGRLQEKTRVSSLTIFRDSLWVATDSGVAVAPLNVGTLRLPSVWTVIGATAGLAESKIRSVKSNNDILAVASDKTAYTFLNGVFTPVITPGATILSMTVNGSEILVSTAYSLVTNSSPIPAGLPGEILGHARTLIGGTLLVFVRDRSLAYLSDTEFVPIIVNSPISNQFASVSVDTKGGLWVATDVDPPRTGIGVTHFDGKTWSLFNPRTVPEILTDACYRVSSLSDGSTWIGTWGRGAVKCTPSDTGFRFERYDDTNSELKGITNDSKYVLAGEVALDRQGRTWIVNEQAADRVLTRFANGEWRFQSNCTDSRNNLFRSIAVDNFGGVWMGSPHGSGVLFLNDRNTVAREDDFCNSIRSSNSQLPDNAISSIRSDRTGAIWIGTAKGVAVISSPGAATSSTLPFIRRISALSNSVVNDIYVDALNNKWVATTGGVFVLNTDGTEVIGTITTTTTPLLDDNVRSIAIDDLSGLAYFGTSTGCSVAKTSSIRPADAFDLRCYPQPFRPSIDENVVIDGLASDADVRIITSGGLLVAALQVRGRQAIWDGMDTQGNQVQPGVYIISASSAGTNSSAAGKLAVTR